MGVGLNTTEGYGAVELVRMAVHPEFRGKGEKFPLMYSKEKRETKHKHNMSTETHKNTNKSTTNTNQKHNMSCLSLMCLCCFVWVFGILYIFRLYIYFLV